MSFLDKVISEIMYEYQCTRLEAVQIISNKALPYLESKAKTYGINESRLGFK